MCDFAFPFLLFAAMCALSNECLAHILCWSTWDDLPGQLRVSGHWNVQGAFTLQHVAFLIVPDLSFVIQPAYQPFLSTSTSQVRANRIIAQCEREHFLLDMDEFRKIVHFQLWMRRGCCETCRGIVAPIPFGRIMFIHDIVQHLLHIVHHGLVGSRLQHVFLHGIPETACIQRNQIGFINLAWRRSSLDQFCLGRIVELLLHMKAWPYNGSE